MTHLFRAAALTLVLAPVLAAQTATPPPAETYELDPFVVKSASTNGYLAAESTTGSRYAAPIKEIPFPIQVITSDFIENFLAFDFSDAVAYTSSFTPTEGTGAFVLRGIRNFSHYKNGIREGGVYGPVAVERIEVIKGANSAIYGQTEPTGLRNIVTKKATPKAFQNLRVNFGTDEFSRVAIDVNQPLVADKVLTRFAASTEHSEQFVSDFARYRRMVFYNSTTWKIRPATTFTVNSEYIQFRSHAQLSGALPFVLESRTVNGVAGNYVTALTGTGDYSRFYSLNTGGPKGYNDVAYFQIDGTLSHKINDVLSVRLLGNQWKRNQNIVRNSLFSGANANTFNPATGVLSGNATPRLERNREWQANGQVDLLAHFRTGRVEHKFLITGDYFLYDGDIRNRTSSRADAAFPLNNLITPGGPTYSLTFPYDFNYEDTSVWNNTTANVRRQTVTKGLMLSERAALWDGRLIALVGFRHDETFNTQLDYRNTTVANGVLTPVGQMVRFRTEKADTWQTGSLFKIDERFSAYANFSQSFNPQRTDLATNIDQNGAPLPPQEGEGFEFGVKASLFSDALNFTAGYFDIDKTNVPRVARDALGNPILIPGVPGGPATRQYSNLNDINSEGLELDFNWQVNDRLSVFGGLGYNKVKFTSVENLTERFLLGVTPDNTPKWTGGISADYKFATGPLKGLSARLGVRYQGEMLINNTTASPFGNSGVAGAPITVAGTPVTTYFFKNADYWLVDLGFAYSWRGGNGWRHRVSLDGRNIADEKYIRVNKPGDPLSVNLTYELKL